MIRFLLLLLAVPCFVLSQTLSEQGIRLNKFYYKGDSLEYIVHSKRGEENIKKPIIFLCQGSLPQPPVINNNGNFTPIFLPFDYRRYLDKFHIVVVSKSGIPAIVASEGLNENYMFLDSNGSPPKKFIDNNYLEYYYKRNIFLLKRLNKEKWVEKNNFTVISHSEGSYIAVMMAHKYTKIKKIIYSGGNPLGRIMSIISQDKQNNSSSSDIESDFQYWKDILSGEETDISTFSYSDKNFFETILSLKIPVLVTYGGKDWNAIFNDYLRIETLRLGKSNFTFKVYYDTDHNFFKLNNCNEVESNEPLWQNVGNDWLDWIQQ